MSLTNLIITAMQEEAELIITEFALKHIETIRHIKCFEGLHPETNEHIALILGGIGKIQASVATSYGINRYKHISKLINIGIAGTINTEKLHIGDVIIPHHIVQHDMYLPFEGSHLDYAKKAITISPTLPPLLEYSHFSLHTQGCCATGDMFVDSASGIESLRTHYQADICEMEAFAIASVAREYDLLDHCIFIKAVSDGANNEAREDHMTNLEFAMNNSITVLKHILHTTTL